MDDHGQAPSRVSCLIDTTSINHLVDGSLDPSYLPSGMELLVTHVQIDELNRTSDEERRARLYLKLAELRPRMIPTESWIIGVSRLNQCKLSDGVLWKAIKADFDSLNGGKRNNIMDALIVETAIVNRYILITGDYHMMKVTLKHGGTIHYVRAGAVSANEKAGE